MLPSFLAPAVSSLAQTQLTTVGRVSAFEAGLEQAERLAQLSGEGPKITPETKPTQSESQSQSQSDGWPVPFPADALAGHEGDLERVKTLHSIMKPLAIDNTVIVIPANLGFLDQALSLRCRLISVGGTNVLIWALDKETTDKMSAMGVPHYYDPTLFSVSGAVGYGINNEVKGRMMSERPRVWWRILATGFNMLFLDADVVAFARPEKLLEGGADLEGQLDYQAKYGWGLNGVSNESTICAGIFWIKSSGKGLKFMDKVIKSFEIETPEKMKVYKERNRWDDQLALNFIIHDPDVATILNPQPRQSRVSGVSDDKFTIVFSDPMKVMGGTMISRTSITGHSYAAEFSFTAKEGEAPTKFQPIVMHLNGYGTKAKVDLMKGKGWWQIDDAGNCAS